MTPQELKYSIISRALSGRFTSKDGELFDIAIKEVQFEDDEPFAVPNYWKWSNLGACCNMYTGNSISESVKKSKYTGLKNGYDYIGTKDVTFDQKIIYNNGVKIPINDKFKIAYKNAILMCIEGGSAGRKIGILDRDVCFGNKLCMFKSDVIFNKYIYYYLQSFEFRKIFNGLMTGIIGGVSIKKLKSIPIPIPPLTEQKQIVIKIEEILPLINCYEQAYTRFENFNKRFPLDMQKSILQMAMQGKLVEQRVEEGTGKELYHRLQSEKNKMIQEGKIKKEKSLPEIKENEIPVEIPENWTVARVGSIAYKVTDGTHKTPKYSQSGIKFVSAKNLYSGVLDFTDCKFISENEHIELYKRCNPERGDILISKSGSIGTVTIVDVDFEFSMFESLALIKYNQEIINSKYFLFALQNACYHLSDDNIRGVAVKHLPIADIKKLIIPIPPLNEQKRIVKKLEKLLFICKKIK